MFRGDSTPSVQIWFNLPDSIANVRNNKLAICGVGLIICGFASIANAAMAVAYRATKEFYLHDYVNTHFITSIYLLAGLSTIAMHKLRLNYFLFTTICLDSISTMVAAGAFIFDCANLNYLRTIDNPYYKTYFYNRKPALIAYAAIDIINSGVAVIFSIVALREVRHLSKRYFNPINDLKSKPLLYCSILQCLIGQSKLMLWMIEVAWSRNLGLVKQFVFFNYTMDEPVWDLIYTMTGIFGILVAIHSGRVLSFCSLALTTLSVFPVIQYLWIDYRWLLNIRTSDIIAKIPKPHILLHMNIALSVLHLFVILLITILMLRQLVRNGLPWNTSKISIEATLKQTIMFSGSLQIAAGTLLLVTDVTHVISGTFFRLFIPGEQRLPFLLVPAGVLCLIMVRYNEFVPYATACLIPLLVMCLQTASFHIASFLYLSNNAYFSSNLCQLFFFGNLNCKARVEKFGTYGHFLEAVITLFTIAVSLYLMVVLTRLCRLFALILQYPMTEEERKKLNKRKCWLYALGFGQLSIGLAVLCISIMLPGNEHLQHSPHPFIFIHTFIYRISLSLPFLAYPILQLLLFEKVHLKPMNALTCVFISYVWIVDVFLQLDYRILDSLGFGWKLTTAMEIWTLILQFGIGSECVLLLDMGQNRLPQFDFTDYTGVATRIQSGLEFKDDEESVENEKANAVEPADPDHVTMNKV